MPPSPANFTRLRSESLDVFSAYKSRKNLFSPKQREEPLPSSVEYWLPAYENISEYEIDYKEQAKSFLQSLTLSFKHHKGKE
jgi:hypothetical protein